MTMIESMPASAVLTEGAAVRLGESTQTDAGETHVYFDACEEHQTVSCDVQADGTGRTLEVALRLRGMCPNRRVAVGFTVCEVDDTGCEHPRGFRALTVPAHTSASCCDVQLPSMRFLLPDDIRVDGGRGLCNGRRHFVLRSEANYIDRVGL